jgi:enamidase
MVLSDATALATRMRVAIVNIGRIVSGDWRNPFAGGDTILAEAGRILSVGSASSNETR